MIDKEETQQSQNDDGGAHSNALAGYMPVILQQEKTLDDVLLSAMNTFYNGCNFRLVKREDGCFYLQYGCYGVHTNMTSGDEKLLHVYLSDTPNNERKLTHTTKPETIIDLMQRKPCKRCGGIQFYKKEGM